MLDPALADAYRERQGDDDCDEPEARHRSCHPKTPQQHDSDRHYRVLRAAAEMGCFGCRRFGGMVQRSRPTPNSFQRDSEKAEAQRVGDKLAPFRREAKSGQKADSDPSESKPADERRQP